jgi:hypothetical protein
VLSFVLLSELLRRQVAQTRVRAHVVVVSAPLLDHDSGLGARPEPLDIQALVAEWAKHGIWSAHRNCDRIHQQRVGYRSDQAIASGGTPTTSNVPSTLFDGRLGDGTEAAE